VTNSDDKLTGYSAWVLEQRHEEGRDDEPLPVTVRLTPESTYNAATLLESAGLQLDEQFGDICMGHIAPSQVHRLTELSEVRQVEIASQAKLH
jgi:hypothetical protein